MAESTNEHVGAELVRLGRWLRKRRPRVRLEEVDADLLTKYMVCFRWCVTKL